MLAQIANHLNIRLSSIVQHTHTHTHTHVDVSINLFVIDGFVTHVSFVIDNNICHNLLITVRLIAVDKFICVRSVPANKAHLKYFLK